jgi:3-methyladenine DNA glycosylase AlkD
MAKRLNSKTTGFVPLPGPVLSPEILAQEALAELRKISDPRRAQGAQRYFKEAVRVMGAETEDCRALAKSLFGKVKGRWTFTQATSLCEILLNNPYLEAKAAGVFVLGRFIPDAHPVFFLKMRNWLEAGLLDSWASSDTLCGEVLSPFVARFPELRYQFKSWTESKSLWVQRSAAVVLVPFARRGQWLDLAYDVAGRLFPSGEDLIHKASGWLLREAGKTNMGRLEKYLRANGKRMPRTAVRYAIEKFDPKKRKAILAATSR